MTHDELQEELRAKRKDLRAALVDLIRRYEAGERRLDCGLCWELGTTYHLPSEWGEDLIDRFYAPQTQYVGLHYPYGHPVWTMTQEQQYEAELPHTLLGPKHHFTEARYNLVQEMLRDLDAGRFADWPPPDNRPCIDYPGDDDE
jgi:hypothetical protein